VRWACLRRSSKPSETLQTVPFDCDVGKQEPDLQQWACPQKKTMHEEGPGSRRLCNSRGIGARLLAVRWPCARRWSLHELFLYGRALADDPCTPPRSGSMHPRLRSDGACVATRSTNHLESMSLACNNELAHVT